MAADYHYLYHLRDPENTAGFGFDAYVGTTNDPKRRYAEHMRLAAAGRHTNRRVQTLYDNAGGNLQMRIVRRGAKEQVLASEALVINRPNKHANIQAGGGPLRGLSQEELIKRADLSAGYETSANWRRAQGTSTQQLALIAATGAALAACAFFGYQWYKKSKSKRRRESDFGASTTNTRRAASAEGTTEAAEADAGRHADSRRAKFKELRKLNLQVIGLLALQMTVAAIATAVGD